MKQIEQINRDQVQIMSLEMMVSKDSIVRLLDVFLDFSLSTDLGFKISNQTTGRPSFPVRTLLGIYIYGYLHRTRSSRALEKACNTNVELWWLLGEQKPCYKTIANFRKDNRQAFKNLFKSFRTFCKTLELYGKETIAIDGSKFRAQNSRKNNFSEAKINKHLEYIETKQKEYLDSLDIEDRKRADTDPSTHQRLVELASRKVNYEDLKEKLSKSESKQISTTDPDAKALPLNMNAIEIAYNVQSAVDDKHNLIVDYEVTNEKDTNALAPMAIKSKDALDLSIDESIVVLADKGYCKGEQIQECHDNNIDTLVSVREYTDKSKPSHLTKDKFIYNSAENTYTCPSGNILSHQSRYQRKKEGKVVGEFDRYTIQHSICINCSFYDDCVSYGKKNNSQGRCIDRSSHQGAVDKNKLNINSRKQEYKRRQAIVEHPFGTLKRAWGYTYTLMKTIPKVETEFSIIFLCYNLRRVMSILGHKELKMALKRVGKQYLGFTSLIRLHTTVFKSDWSEEPPKMTYIYN